MIINEVAEIQQLDLRDVEESIVSYLIKNPEAIARYGKYLSSMAFGIKEYRIVYEALIALNKLECPIDAVRVEAFLVERNLLDVIGGIKSLARIAGGNKLVRQPSEKSIAKSIEGLCERYKRSQMLDRTTRLQTELGDATIPYSDLSERVERWAIDFMSSISDSGGLEHIESTIKNTVEAVISRTLQARQGDLPGIPTGWVDLDELTGGWRGGKLITIAARPHAGKSLFVGNTLTSIARSRPVAFFSLEMSTTEVEERFLSAYSGIDSSKIRDGKLDNEDFDLLERAAQKLSLMKFWGDNSTATTADSIVSQSRRFKAKYPDLGAIAIDYLQLMVQGDNPNLEVSKITRKLKCLAMELDCPIFLLSQLNRGVEARNDKRPVMSDLRDSGSIEQDSDMILMIYRDVIYNPDTPDRDIAEILIRKFRNGKCGTVKLVFDGAGSQFKNLIKF